MPRSTVDNYAVMHANFRWQVPAHFNIAEECCGRWARRPDADTRVAIRAHASDPQWNTLTFAELQLMANALSNLLVSLEVKRGDRVAIVMPQRFETAVAYMAVLQMGAVAMPLSILFGPDALEYRLQNSDAVVAICDENSFAAVREVRSKCASLRKVIGVGKIAEDADVHYARMTSRQSSVFTAVKTKADDGAILIYTSGTTGPPKGALIPHRAMMGNLPGFVCSHNWFGFDGKTNASSDAVFWSPADWAWTGGLMDALLPSLYFGRPIVAYTGRFSP
jgi:acetyl-CoA synthetase